MFADCHGSFGAYSPPTSLWLQTGLAVIRSVQASTSGAARKFGWRPGPVSDKRETPNPET